MIKNIVFLGIFVTTFFLYDLLFNVTIAVSKHLHLAVH